MSKRAKGINKTGGVRRGNSAPRVRKTYLSQSKGSPVEQVLHLQQTIGNQAVQRLFKSGVIQTKLKIGKPNDKYEREADRVANQIVSSSKNDNIQTDVNERNNLRPKIHPINNTSSQTADIPESVKKVVNSGQGRPLDSSTRIFMESRFGGLNLSNVRIYKDTRAAESANAIGAVAYAVGRNIVFSRGTYSPQTTEGKRLLAHELEHVKQQNFAPQRIQCKPRGVRRVEGKPSLWLTPDAWDFWDRFLRGQVEKKDEVEIRRFGPSIEVTFRLPLKEEDRLRILEGEVGWDDVKWTEEKFTTNAQIIWTKGLEMEAFRYFSTAEEAYGSKGEYYGAMDFNRAMYWYVEKEKMSPKDARIRIRKEAKRIHELSLLLLLYSLAGPEKL